MIHRKPGSGTEVPSSVSSEALRNILRQSTENPQSQLHRRLRESDGGHWFLRTLEEKLEGIRGGEDVARDRSDRTELLHLKKTGKRLLGEARSVDETQSAAAVYMGAVVLLLAHPETGSSGEISSLGVTALEETIEELRECLPTEWHETLDRAQSLVD